MCARQGMPPLHLIEKLRIQHNLAASIDPDKYGMPYHPEVLISCRRNLFMGGCDYEVTAKALRNYKFIASFCDTLDEMSDFADLVLPEANGLEKLQFMPNMLVWSMTAQTGYFYYGISDKDTICVESSVGKVTGKAKVTECIHPEAVGISSHFGSLCKGKPVAYGKGANFNKLVPYDTDPVSTGVDGCVKVKVYKV